MHADTAPKRRRRRRSRHVPWYRAWYGGITLVRLIVTTALLVILAGLSVHAGSMGLAHLQVIRVENDLNHWQQTGRVTSPQALESALSAIDRAIRLHRDDPYQLTLKAHLLAWRAYITAEGSITADDSITAERSAATDYRAALELYRRAVALRPLWPNNRTDMINAKLNLNQLDSELDELLRQADALGPYTPAVHIAIVRAGFAKGQQGGQMLQTHLLRGLQDHRSHSQILQLMQQYGKEATACLWLNEAPEPKPNLKFCEREQLSTN